MADENKDEQIEYETKKPLLDAFKDLFKRPAALPGDIPSKHKTTNIDMRTAMSFREFRANIMKSVGDFFQSLSKLGAPKKEESPNKYMNSTPVKSTEPTRTNEENVISQQTIHIPGEVSLNNVRKLTAEDMNVDKAVVENINKLKAEESSFESDSSTDTTFSDTDLEQDVVQNAVPASKLSTGTILTGQVEQTNDKKSKHIIRKKSDTEKGDLEL